ELDRPAGADRRTLGRFRRDRGERSLCADALPLIFRQLGGIADQHVAHRRRCGAARARVRARRRGVNQQESKSRLARIRGGSGLREAAVAGALYVALTLILTYPFSLNVHHGVLAGGADDQEVMWIVGWDVHALTHQPLSIFDANILYPEPKTLAYAENLIGS